MFSKETRNQLLVPDIAFHEKMPCIAAKGGKVLEIPSVGEFVEVDDGIAFRRDPVKDEV